MLSAALLVLAMTPAGGDTIFQDGFDTVSGDCPPGRQVLADFQYGGDNSFRERPDVDVTLWENIWGHATALDTAVPFPGRSTAVPIFLNFDPSEYIAAYFEVPPDMQPDTYGWIIQTEYNHEADLTAAISTACGDFSPPAQACYTQGSGGGNLVPWAVPPPNSFCPLQPGVGYYLNLKVIDSSGCESSGCVIGTANNVHIP
jgi:hypothetical protein